MKAEPRSPAKGKAKPASAPSAAPASTPSGPGDAVAVFNRVVAQGEAVRLLKVDKAPKEQVDAAVKQLLVLKAEFKQLTGQDYKPGMAPPSPSPAPAQSGPAPASTSCPFARVAQQGELVRKLKTEKASKVRCLQRY